MEPMRPLIMPPPAAGACWGGAAGGARAGALGAAAGALVGLPRENMPPPPPPLDPELERPPPLGIIVFVVIFYL